MGVEVREYYAGDTFIRCLTEEWQIKLRVGGGATFTVYLLGAQELQKRDSHKSGIQIPGCPPALLWGSSREDGEKGQSGEERPKWPRETSFR